MLSRTSLRSLYSSAKNAFQALRVVSFAVFTSAGASILQRFIRYFFPSTDTDSHMPAIAMTATSTPTIVPSAPISKSAITKPVSQTELGSQLIEAIKRNTLQKSAFSTNLFAHSSSPPTNVNGVRESKIAKFT